MSSHQTRAVPAPSRPHIPDYGIPDTTEGTLPWSHAVERLMQARNYWVTTAGPDGQPHAVPVWGIWIEGVLVFGGGDKTRWVRNLAANPRIAVHLESGDDVVILEGAAEQITDPEHPLIARNNDAYQAKYGMGAGVPVWVLRPHVAMAWTSFPADATRWVFGRTED